MAGSIPGRVTKKTLVLYVEDDLNDVLLCKHAVQNLGWDLDIEYVPDGQVALEWLAGEGLYADRSLFPMPAIVVTDLKMPRVNGYQLIEKIRGNPKFQNLPIIVYSTSPLESDVKRVIALGATRYVPKSMQMEPLMQCLRGLVVGDTASSHKL